MIDSTVLSTIRIGTLIESLHTQKTYSIAELLNIDYGTLAGLSFKFSMLETELETFVIPEIQNLQKLLFEIPTAYPVEFLETVRRYAKVYANSTLRAGEVGIDAALSENKDEFIEIVRRIRDHQIQLFNTVNSSDVALVSVLLQAEIISMIMANHKDEKFTSEDFKSVLTGYKDWFNKLSLKNQYSIYKAKQQNSIARATALTYVVKCVLERSPPTWMGDEAQKDAFQTEGIIRCRKYGFDRYSLLSNSESMQVQPLLNSSLLVQDDLPSRLKVGWLIIQKDFDFLFGGTPKLVIVNTAPLLNDPDFASTETSYDLARSNHKDCSRITVASENTDSINISNELETNGFILLTYASLALVVDESLKAIDKFLTELP